MRYFTPWQRPREIEKYYLERIVGEITGQSTVPFGDAVISTRDTCLGMWKFPLSGILYADEPW